MAKLGDITVHIADLPEVKALLDDVVARVTAVRDVCNRWIDHYQRQVGAGEYGLAARQILTALDGTTWCAVHRCPGHDAGTEGWPCLPPLRDALDGGT